MPTFLWHPLTPKCTWLSQNKSKKNLRKYWENFFRYYALFYMQGVGIFTEITVLQISSCPHISTAAVVRYLDCIQLLFDCWLFGFWWPSLFFAPKKENELKPATAAGPSTLYLRKHLIGSKSFFFSVQKIGRAKWINHIICWNFTCLNFFCYDLC